MIKYHILGDLYMYKENPDAWDNSLRLTADILDLCDVEYKIYGGVLLGWMRNGAIIPHDNDIDFAIISSEANKLECVVKEMAKRGFELNPYSKGNHTKIMSFGDELPYSPGLRHRHQLRVINNGKETVINSGYRTAVFVVNHVKIEMNVFYKVEDNYYWVVYDPPSHSIATWTMPAHHFNNYETFNYKGREYKIPKDPMGCIYCAYGKDSWSKTPGPSHLHHYKIPQK
jgi:phosphorylcholine metabolism protein LicD